MPTDPRNHSETSAGEPKPAKADGLEAYHTVADTVGMVPNVRFRDNLIQGLVIGGGALISTLVGLVLGGWTGAAIGLVCGLVLFLLVSGAVLMVIGWVRAARKLKK
ncbi:MAG TPA: hypothetical protein PK280_06320 [Planctomycetota bacterium]|nr:hypothetical protein [Planctomycetota bacterium]